MKHGSDEWLSLVLSDAEADFGLHYGVGLGDCVGCAAHSRLYDEGLTGLLAPECDLDSPEVDNFLHELEKLK